jgi:hypothetical protein
LRRKARLQLAAGINPKEAKKPASVVTFGDCAAQPIEAMEPEWKHPKH